MIELNTIYNEDCKNTINSMENEMLDLVITSPPYNVDLGNNKNNNTSYNIYNDNKEHSSYIAWLKEIFYNIYFKLKNGGRVCINIGDGKNGAITTHSDIITFMKNIKYVPITTIIWNKQQVSHRTSWGSWMSPSCPSFPTPFEYILIFGKDSKKLSYKGDSDITKDEFINWSLALWNVVPQTNQKIIGHPAMFPIEIPHRLLKLLSYKDAIVYDPFIGSGTTALACKKYNRNYIGSEISEEYCKIAEQRIKNISGGLF